MCKTNKKKYENLPPNLLREDNVTNDAVWTVNETILSRKHVVFIRYTIKTKFIVVTKLKIYKPSRLFRSR